MSVVPDSLAWTRVFVADSVTEAGTIMDFGDFGGISITGAVPSQPITRGVPPNQTRHMVVTGRPSHSFSVTGQLVEDDANAVRDYFTRSLKNGFLIMREPDYIEWCEVAGAVSRSSPDEGLVAQDASLESSGDYRAGVPLGERTIQWSGALTQSNPAAAVNIEVPRSAGEATAANIPIVLCFLTAKTGDDFNEATAGSPLAGSTDPVFQGDAEVKATAVGRLCNLATWQGLADASGTASFAGLTFAVVGGASASGSLSVESMILYP